MEKDIRFTEKKIDESWKERSDVQAEKSPTENRPEASSNESAESSDKSQINFEAFLNSLGLQALIHLGQVPHPATRQKTLDPEAAQETIELLILIKDKTKGNLTNAEQKLLDALLFDLQSKYVQITQG